jgi:hypothetical protein
LGVSVIAHVGRNACSSIGQAKEPEGSITVFRRDWNRA